MSVQNIRMSDWGVVYFSDR